MKYKLVKPADIPKGPLSHIENKEKPVDRVRHHLYSGIKVSLPAMDRFIAIIVILLFLTLFIGVFVFKK